MIINHRLSIQDMNGREILARVLENNEERDQFLDQYAGTNQEWSPFAASIIPVRTDNLTDFATDLFFPTLVNQALTIDDLATKILVSLVVIAWDLLTLIPRLITAPFRVLYNCTQSTHALVGVIKELPNGAEAIQAGQLKIVETETETEIRVVEGNPLHNRELCHRTSRTSYLVNLKALPNRDQSLRVHEGDHADMVHQLFRA